MLTLSHITVTHKEKLLLEDISLSLEQGTIHALMGQNGSGKSSLAAAIMGYPGYEIVSGLLTYNGQDLLALPIEQRARAGIFLASQQPPAIAGVQVLTFLKEAHRMLTSQDISVTAFKEMAIQALESVHLDQSFLYRNLNEGFSGGEKKRLEVAQLILFRPRLAILDEIDSGLDSDSRKHIAGIIAHHNAQYGMTTLVITHYQSMIDYLQPSYVHIMAKGKIWVTGGIELAKRVEQEGFDGRIL